MAAPVPPPIHKILKPRIPAAPPIQQILRSRIPKAAPVAPKAAAAALPVNDVGESKAGPPPPPALHSLKEKKPEKQNGRWVVETSEDDIDFSCAVPCNQKSFTDPTFWDRVTEVQKSSDGSIGVMFMNSKEGMVVVKSHSTIAQELYATMIGEIIGVSVPHIRAVGYRDSDEWGMIRSTIQRVAKSWGTKLYLNGALYRGMFLIMGYVPGISFEKLHSSETDGNLTPHQLEQLGGLVVFDILMNNHDRFPCAVWNELNSGNPGNCIVGKTELFGIDQNIVALDDMTNVEKLNAHIQKVRDVLEEILAADFGSTTYTQMDEFLHSQIGKSLSVSNFEDMRRGMLITANSICLHLSKELLDDRKNDVKRTIGIDWRDVWKDMVALIKPEFQWQLVEHAFLPLHNEIEKQLN